MWLSEEDENNEPLDADDIAASDQESDMLDALLEDADDFMDEADPDFEHHDEYDDIASEEELEDMYDPTDLEDFG